MTARTRRRTNLRVGAGISTRRSGLAATEDALGAALAPLDGAIPDLAFLFVAPQFEDELESIIESANASLGGGTLLGCVAGGVIGGCAGIGGAGEEGGSENEGSREASHARTRTNRFARRP